RLLNAITGQFDECFDHQRVRYVILSHVWATREATYQDVLETQKVSGLNVVSRLPDKLRGLCNAAQNAGYDFVWADTCCIDRTNSDEISDSITSMYSWYREADQCFAYLHDVPSP
ncbi:heterokaryon incompatibility protein-domain-containing protein, partial [Dichomitus squalens]